MSLGRLLLPSLLVLAASGCSNNNNRGRAFPFERAEHLDFACFAQLAAPRNSEYTVLPESCCRVYDPSKDLMPENPVDCTRAGSDVVGKTPWLHALVTQSTRGEVAAVDLVNNRVLDSDRLVPGYTFLDTGGLPSAIVAPSEQPRVVQPPAPRAPVRSGPAYTYVASAEEYQVRAIATCRFRSGGPCGPDLLPENTDPGYERRTRLSLASAPGDMVLGPGPSGPNQALWVTQPELGFIARIELGEAPTVAVDPATNGGLTDVVRATDAFAFDGTGAARIVKPLATFGVLSAAAVTPIEPIAEDGEYLATCGLGHAFAPAKRILPLAPRSEPTPEVQPDRLLLDEESGLLLVTDRVAPVVHPFRFTSDGRLQALPALPTGTPVRELVLTPRVPANRPRDLRAIPAPAEDPSANTKRYAYAVDDRGLLMVFDFQVDASSGAVTMQPLLAPTPGVGYADRIEVPAPVTALAIIDTRGQSDYVCGQVPDDALRAELTRLQAIEPRDAATQAQINQQLSRISIRDESASEELRGVFLAVSSANGVLSIIDVHDLDASCRARKECCAAEVCTSDEDLYTARNPSNLDAVAVRRHALRRRAVGPLTSTVPNPGLLAPNSCGGPAEPFVPVDGTYLCSPADPWTALSDTWTASYQAALPNTQTKGAAIRPLADPTTAEVLAPQFFNLCDAGVRVGDLVAVLGEPPRRLREDCVTPTADTASVFVIEQAFADRLVVREPSEDAEYRRGTQRSLADIVACYPDSIGIELRAGQFLVLGAGGTYLHRTITGPDGSCVEDEQKDPLLTSRPVGASLNEALSFKNPYVSFTLAASDIADDTLRDTQVQVRNGSSALQLTSVSTTDAFTDALPAALRYDRETGALFLLDTASQGLRRYTLRPFEYDRDSFR